MLPRRDIAVRAGISQQTLYTKALDLVEEAEKRWKAEHAVTLESTQRRPDKRREAQGLQEEISRLNKRIDDISEIMALMVEAVQLYAPNALPQVTKILARAYQKKDCAK